MAKAKAKKPEIHHDLGGSTTGRWMTCSASVKAIRDAKDSGVIPEHSAGSAAATEGTIAHALGEKCLKKKFQVSDFFNKKFEGAIMDESFIDAVTDYVSYVRGRVELLVKQHGKKNVKLLIEQKSNLDDYVDEPCGGPADCVILVRGELVEVIDYKHGKGIVVEIKGNTQLRLYGLGIYRKYKDDWKPKRVVITIVQPRAYHPDGAIRSENITAKRMRNWGKNVLIPAVQLTKSKDAKFVPSESSCMWCPIAGCCTANAEQMLDVMKLDFRDFSSDDPLDLADPRRLKAATISGILQHKSQIESWIKAVYSQAYDSALLGTQFDEFKLVERQSNRKFLDAGKAVRILKKKKGVDADELFQERQLKTPAQVEVYLSSLGWKSERISKVMLDLIERTVTGSALVSIDDNREAMAPPAETDFDGISPKKKLKKPKKRKGK